MLSGKKVKMSVRQAKLSDVPRLLEIDAEIWPDFRATREMFESRIETFPQGQFVVVVDGLVVGSAYSELIDYSVWSDKRFTWQEITNNGTIRQTHVVNGDSFYGVGMAVAKNFQGSVASELLTKSAVKLVITRNIRQILLGARIPSYHKYADRFLVEDYIKQTKGSRLLDPELAFYGKYDGHPIKILPNYIYDPESLNYGVLIQWENPYYNKITRKLIPLMIKTIQRQRRHDVNDKIA